MTDGDGIHSLGSERAEGRKTWLWKEKDPSVGLGRKVFPSCGWCSGEGALGVIFVFPSESDSSRKGHMTQKGPQDPVHAHPGDVWGLGLSGYGEWCGWLEDRKNFSRRRPLSFVFFFSLPNLDSPPRAQHSPILLGPHLWESFHL